MIIDKSTWDQMKIEVTRAVLARGVLRGVLMQEFDDHVRVAVWAMDEDDTNEATDFTSDLSVTLASKFGDWVVCRTFTASESDSLSRWVPLAWGGQEPISPCDSASRSTTRHRGGFSGSPKRLKYLEVS